MKKKKSGAVKGANKGKLAPGEKQRMKKEKMHAKRAARAATHGLDLETVNAELIHFVASRGDMKVHLVHALSVFAALHAAASHRLLTVMQHHKGSL